MLFHRKGILPAPMKRTTRKPASFNSCERVLRDQNLMCPLSQKGIEMCVPLFGERKNKILRVAVIRRADDKVTAGPEELLRETRLARCSITSVAIATSKLSLPTTDGSSSTPSWWKTSSGAELRANRTPSALGSQPTTSYPRRASSRQSAPLPHPISTTLRAPNSAHKLKKYGHRYASVCAASAEP